RPFEVWSQGRSVAHIAMDELDRLAVGVFVQEAVVAADGEAGLYQAVHGGPAHVAPTAYHQDVLHATPSRVWCQDRARALPRELPSVHGTSPIGASRSTEVDSTGRCCTFATPPTPSSRQSPPSAPGSTTCTR